MIFPTGAQLSVAVAVPVLAASDEASQLIVMSAGQITTGFSSSVTIIVCVHGRLMFPCMSVAVQRIVVVPTGYGAPRASASLRIPVT